MYMAYILIIVLLGGLFMYLFCSGSKAQDIGRLTFFAAVLALLVALAPWTVKLLGK